MQSRDGQKGRNRPEPLERPGVSRVNRRKFGATRMDFAEADAWLAGEGVVYDTTSNDLIL